MIAWVGGLLLFLSHIQARSREARKYVSTKKMREARGGKSHINITSLPFFPWSTALETLILEIFQSGLEFKRFIKYRIITTRELDHSGQAVMFKELLIHTYLQAAALTVTQWGACEFQPSAAPSFFLWGHLPAFAQTHLRTFLGRWLLYQVHRRWAMLEPFGMISHAAAVQAALEAASFHPTCCCNSN